MLGGLLMVDHHKHASEAAMASGGIYSAETKPEEPAAKRKEPWNIVDENTVERSLYGPALFENRLSTDLLTAGIAVAIGENYSYAAGANVPSRVDHELLFGTTALRFQGVVSKVYLVDRRDGKETWLLANVFKVPDRTSYRQQSGSHAMQTISEGIEVTRINYDWNRPGLLMDRPTNLISPRVGFHFEDKTHNVALCLYLTMRPGSRLVFENWDEITAALTPLISAIYAGKQLDKIAPLFISRLIDGLKIPRAVSNSLHHGEYVLSCLSWARHRYSLSFLATALTLFLRYQPENIRRWRRCGVRTVVVGPTADSHRILFILFAFLRDTSSEKALEKWYADYNATLFTLGEPSHNRTSSAVASETGWKIPTQRTSPRRVSVTASAQLSRPSTYQSSLFHSLNKYRFSSGSLSSTPRPDEDSCTDLSIHSRGSFSSQPLYSVGSVGKDNTFGGRRRVSTDSILSTPGDGRPLYQGPMPPLAGYTNKLLYDRAVQACPAAAIESGQLVEVLDSERKYLGGTSRAIVIDLDRERVYLWTTDSAGIQRAVVDLGGPAHAVMAQLNETDPARLEQSIMNRFGIAAADVAA